MNQKKLEEYLWGAANILRGMIDAADFKQYIFPLLFFKRVSDIWDEEFEDGLKLSDGDMDYAKFRENHRFQIPDGCHWSDIRATSTDIGKKLQTSLHEIENLHNNIGFRQIEIKSYYRVTDYFSFFMPIFIIIAIFENLFKFSDLKVFASGIILVAKK